MNVIELFSGIGSQTRALANNVEQGFLDDYKIVLTSDWDIHSIIAYDIINNGEQILGKYENMKKEELVKELADKVLSRDGKEPITSYQNIDVETLKRLAYAIERSKNIGSITKLTAETFPKEFVDLMTYSFPCQDLSNVGIFHGYNKGIDRDCGSRSSLLWEVERVLLELEKNDPKRLPNFLLMENVTSITAPRHLENFNEWRGSLEKLGYTNFLYNLNAKDFGVPQNRPRAYMLSIKTNHNEMITKEIMEYVPNNSDEFYKKRVDTNNFRKLELKDVLKLSKDYWDEAIIAQPNDTASRRSIHINNPKLANMNNEKTELGAIVRTLTTKQDRHPNSGIIDFDSGVEGRAAFRYLTPRECFILMGFKEEDYELLVKSNFNTTSRNTFFPRDRMYKLTGNSIVVNVLQEIFKLVNEVNVKYFDKQ